jgi:hypothetical protein
MIRTFTHPLKGQSTSVLMRTPPHLLFIYKNRYKSVCGYKHLLHFLHLMPPVTKQ